MPSVPYSAFFPAPHWVSHLNAASMFWRARQDC
jgi:hypothetical protein